jgi:hypothetical protein
MVEPINMTTVTLELPEHLIPLIARIGDQLPLVIELGLSRVAPVSSRAYVEAIEFLAQDPSDDSLAGFRFSEGVEEAVNELLHRDEAGELSAAEQTELDRLSHLEEQLQLAKARALRNRLRK